MKELDLQYEHDRDDYEQMARLWTKKRFCLITVINIFIAVILHRVSHTSFDWYIAKEKVNIESAQIDMIKKELISVRYCYQSSQNSSLTTDTNQAIKRRTSAQVTRILLAITLSLIIFNIPNTIVFLFTRINDRQLSLPRRPCLEISDSDIRLYKKIFYSTVIQDILSDLPHIVNFFLYCLAGKKFRNIFLNEVYACFIETHSINRKQKRFTANGSVFNPKLTYPAGLNGSQRRILYRNTSLKCKKATNTSYNTLTNKLTFNDKNHNCVDTNVTLH
ncbi:unnamed protein product [Rotaria sp. Silwood2]|nr:unnamed protein product [Rotaria sp. Silwood2]CAF4085686.1 unnamed protein product [Rotaria sp. Silwood2]